MLEPKDFYSFLAEHGIDFFTGVPDSLLKDFCSYVTDTVPEGRHIIAANEGGAVALAAGYHLATGKFGLVYMQNSGEGNAVNPLASLTDPEVYGIPVLLLIGWRGEPGVKDEPQHVKQGKITFAILESLGIPHATLPDNAEGAKEAVRNAAESMKNTGMPYALVVRKGIFGTYKLFKKEGTPKGTLVREEAVKIIVDELSEKDVVISTTGMTSRELFEYREGKGQGHAKDFLTVGSMGHSSQIALGIAMARPDRRVYCIDGDGAVIMHMGSLAIAGTEFPKNFRHIVINNGSFESVGGQPTAGFKINIPDVAKACGYSYVATAATAEEIRGKVEEISSHNGPALLEVIVKQGHRSDLGRPTTTPQENKKAFMEFLKD